LIYGKNFSLYFIAKYATSFIMFGDKFGQYGSLSNIIDDRNF